MRIGEILAGFRAKTADIVQSGWTNHRKAFLLGLVAFLLLVLLALIGVLLVMNYSNAAAERAAARELSDTFRPMSIPPEDLFLPGEPDFLPEVLLEKEKQSTWTGEDARPFWEDPLQDDPDRWRDRVETVIDRLMERVP
jgi:hypothetical protein